MKLNNDRLNAFYQVALDRNFCKAACPARLQPHDHTQVQSLSVSELQALYPNALIFNESFAPSLD